MQGTGLSWKKKRHAGLKSGASRKVGIARLRGLPKSARWLPRDNPTRASRRKRSFFLRRRDTPVFVRSKDQKTGFAQRAQRTQRKDLQGTGLSWKKKRHAGLKSGVPRKAKTTHAKLKFGVPKALLQEQHPGTPKKLSQTIFRRSQKGKNQYMLL